MSSETALTDDHVNGGVVEIRCGRSMEGWSSSSQLNKTNLVYRIEINVQLLTYTQMSGSWSTLVALFRAAALKVPPWGFGRLVTGTGWPTIVAVPASVSGGSGIQYKRDKSAWCRYMMTLQVFWEEHIYVEGVSCWTVDPVGHGLWYVFWVSYGYGRPFICPLSVAVVSLAACL